MSAVRKYGEHYRARQLARIHVVKAKLKLDDETYRQLLDRVAGKRSAADLDQRGRDLVLDELSRLQGVARKALILGLPGAPVNVRDDVAAMVGMVAAILAEADRSWDYAHGLAHKMFHVARVEWLHADQLHKLVAALLIDQKRRRARAK